MSDLSTTAPSALDVPISPGTWVSFDELATFPSRDYVTGGSPWRLLRLPGNSASVAERWKNGAFVRPGEERFARTLVLQGLLHPHYRADVDVDDIDVVIPVLEDIVSLRQLLSQLQGFHVTVVDDASVDPILIEECTRQFDVDLVRLEDNAGPGAARNAGARATSRPVLCFLDADVSIEDAHDVIGRLKGQLRDPLVGACAPRVRGGDGSSVRDRFERRFGPLDMGEHAGLVVPGADVGYVPSACLLVRRDALGDGFNETLRNGEDVDLVWRLHDQGWLVRYLADVVVTHRARGTWRHWLAQRVDYGVSSAELAARHGDRLAPVRTDPWTLIAWASVLWGRPTIAARIVRVVRSQLRTRIGEHADEVTDEVVNRAILRAGGPLARATVRTFGTGLLLAALHPRLRRRALMLFALGTAWRWRHERFQPRDVPLALADDAAYGFGVVKGSWRTRSLAALTPRLTPSSIRVRDVLGLNRSSRSPG